MTQNVRPYSPSFPRFRVKAAYRSFVTERFGVMYAHAELSRRGEGETHPLYAPVTLMPGDVMVFTWPAIEMRREWLELCPNQGDPFANVESLRWA